MKALAIVALIFSCVSVFIPVVGIFIAMLCSFMAMISFRSQPTISGVAFGINILSTAFLSPSIVASEIVMADPVLGQNHESGDIYIFYVSAHVVLFTLAILWRLVRGAPKQVA